jgi:hypothetical protein
MSGDTGHHSGSQWARDIHGVWKEASREGKNRRTLYFCECPDKHKMKLCKPSGKPGIRYIRPYFAQISSGHKHTREGEIIACRSGGESMQHRAAKHMLREMVGEFQYVSKRCKACHTNVIEDGRDATIILETQSTDKRWRYDCMLIRHGIRVAALEIYHKHATAEEKVISTRSNGIAIAEFRAEDVNAMKGSTFLENLRPLSYTCQHCLLNASKSWILRCHAEDRKELQLWESVIADAYHRDYNERKRRLHDDMMWMSTRCTDEINQWRFKETTITEEYNRLWEIGQWKIRKETSGMFYYSVYHPPPYTNGIYAPYEMICVKGRTPGDTLCEIRST